jgi:carboxypeptidase family protein
MKGSCLGRMAVRWPAGSALLIVTLASQALATGTITGTLKAPTGWSLDGTWVTAYDANNHLFRTMDIAADGTYKIDSVDPGTYTLSVAARGLEVAPIQNLVLADGQTLKQDLTLTPAKPFCFVKSANPIPLTDDINSASFMDATDIHVDSAAHLNEPVGDLPTLNKWGGPATSGGRFRVKYSSAGLHIAADVTYKVPNVNLATGANIYQGNAIELDFQNDPYDQNRTAFDNDHDWQLIVSLGQTPEWWIYGGLQEAPMINGKPEPVTNHVLVKDRPNKDGNLVRIDVPWAILLKGDMMTPIAPPKDMDLGAAELAVDQSSPDSTKDAPMVLYQLTWSGLDTGFQDPSVMKPIQFCPQAP